jgi:hypothetical protein
MYGTALIDSIAWAYNWADGHVLDEKLLPQPLVHRQDRGHVEGEGWSGGAEAER